MARAQRTRGEPKPGDDGRVDDWKAVTVSGKLWAKILTEDATLRGPARWVLLTLAAVANDAGEAPLPIRFRLAQMAGVSEEEASDALDRLTASGVVTLAPHPTRPWRSLFRLSLRLAPSKGAVREAEYEALALLAAFHEAPDDRPGHDRARALLGQAASRASGLEDA